MNGFIQSAPQGGIIDPSGGRFFLSCREQSGCAQHPGARERTGILCGNFREEWK